MPSMIVPWMPLLRQAVEAEGAKPMLLGLATVDSSRGPQVRSIVCRRVDDRGSLWITSDSRSAKNAQLIVEPRASAVYWAAASRQQFRLSGQVHIRLSADDLERNRMWQEMNPETRAAFFWPTPGAARALTETFVTAGKTDLPPATFSVLVLEPTTVDLLDVSVLPHTRRRWTKGREWQVEDINP